VAAATIQDHLSVAFRLAKREPDAIKEIANTQAAFWYSFQAALISLPLMLVTIFLGPEPTPGLLGVLAEVSLFVVGWLLFPVVMLEVVPHIDRTQEYCRYIAASNWCSVLEDAALTAIVVLQAVNIIPETIGGFAFFICVVWVFSYQFFVARHGLKVEVGIAAMIIGLRLLLSLVLFAVQGIIGG
jgi:hypothetical protein